MAENKATLLLPFKASGCKNPLSSSRLYPDGHDMYKGFISIELEQLPYFLGAGILIQSPGSQRKGYCHSINRLSAGGV